MLRLLDLPKEVQKGPAVFIAYGRRHFAAANLLINYPARDSNGFLLKREDGKILLTFELLNSALILFQVSFELLLKALIKLKGGIPPASGKRGHDLLVLWDMAGGYFQGLNAVSKEDLENLGVLSSVTLDADGNRDLSLMRLKYGKSGVWLPEHGDALSECFSRIYRLIDQELQRAVLPEAV